MQDPREVLGLPPAELPQGTTSLPNFNELPEVQTIQSKQHYRTPPPEADYEIRQYPIEVQTAIRAWWPYTWGRQSQHLGCAILTIHALVAHIDAATKAELALMKAQAVQKSATFSEEFAQWQKECQLRKVWIESKAAEWRKRVGERAANVGIWDKYVEEARVAMQDAKATSAPPRPRKS